jgi:hypothetical protein
MDAPDTFTRWTEHTRHKPSSRGCCWLCSKFTERIEGHHLQYDPELKIGVCHDCHHKIHFTPHLIPPHTRERMVRFHSSLHPDWSPDVIRQKAEHMHPCGKATMQ